MTIRNGIACVLACVLAPSAAPAHHSDVVIFDTNQEITWTGTLSSVDWRNPHIALTIETEDNGDRLAIWSFAGPPPSRFRAASVSKSDFEGSLGKTITIKGSPARDGSLSGVIHVITLADGRAWSF